MGMIEDGNVCGIIENGKQRGHHNKLLTLMLNIIYTEKSLDDYENTSYMTG